MQITNCFKKKTSMNFLLTIILLGLFLAFLPQTQAAQSQTPPNKTTLASPNPVPYRDYGIAGGMYGKTVACAGNYIFVYGEQNFYVYNAKGKALIKTIPGSTIATGNKYVAISDFDITSSSCKVDIYRLNNLNKIVATLTSPEEGHYGFGLSMAISDDKLLISDVGYALGDHPFSGDVYIYSIPDFNYITKLEQTNPERAAFGRPFGYSMAFCEDHIFVGSPQQTVNEALSAGIVYIYSSETYLWEKTIPGPQANQQGTSWGSFGESLAVSGDKIWITEKGFVYPQIAEVGEINGAGIVYCYSPEGELIKTLSTQNPALYGFFGSSIAANDEYVIVGAEGETLQISNEEETTQIYSSGRVYIFSANGNYVKTLTSLNPQEYGQFGRAVTIGNGYFVIGAPQENATARDKSNIQTYRDAGVTYILK